MFKRANKITSLLLAGAAVMSLVPAYASDVKKIESEDGTVYNAIAYKDGEFYIDGEVNDKDEAAYYVTNGKYNNLSDIDAGSDVSTYGTKYVDINDGDYFVDLTSGKVTDNSVASDARDDAASNLRKKVKADTDGRYLKDGSTAAADTLKNYDSTTAAAVTIDTATEASKIYSISGSKFGDEWFATAFTNKDKTNGLNDSSGVLNVYTDGSGKYIDADFNLGKIKVETAATTGAAVKTVYIENTDDTYDTAAGGNVAAKVGKQRVIGQDKDYIYRFATVTVYTTGSTATISEIDGHSISSAQAGIFNTGTANQVSFRVLQKISKAQSSGDIGGVKYAKTAYTYLLSDDSENLKSKSDFENYEYFTVANGKVVGYNENSDTVDIQTATLKSENGLYYLDLGSSSNDDVEVLDSKLAVDVDVDGNVWRLNGGYLYEWNNDEDWDKVYKVDGSFNQLSVYDKNNIVAWNQDDEVYSVIGNKKADDTPIPTTPAVTKGWVKAADGTWSYNKADGSKAIGWLQDGGAWYYLKSDGVMATGWINDNGTWYYLNPVYGGPLGAMRTGWINDNGTWYYCNASGAMKTGWINDNGTWYYCNYSGAMLANTTVDGYKLGPSGAWIK